MDAKHRFWVPPDQVNGGTVCFSDEQGRQIASVLRLRTGARVRVFDGVALVDRLVEIAVTGPRVVGQVVGEVAQPAEPRVRLAVYPALLQRDKFEQVLQKLVEVGASSVTPVLTTRGLVREAPDERRRNRWQSILREAAEQTGRGVVPRLGETLPLPAALQEAARRPAVVAYEEEQQFSLRQALAQLGRPEELALFVGPEGGYEPREIALARSAGAQVVSLGPRILRTETASPVFAALVLFGLGELG